MTDNEIDKIIEKLIKSPLSGYYIAKKTCITETTISNYRKKLTRPTAANAKLLEYFFSKEKDGGQSIIGNNNTMAGDSIINSDDTRIRYLEDLVKEKDTIIKQLIQTNTNLVNQINALINK